MRDWGFVSNSKSRDLPGRPLTASLGFLLALSFWPVLAETGRLPGRYDQWLNQEVVYLISDEERKAFLRLGTDAARDQFIEEFWAARNPVRNAGRNPAREEHYRRLAYVNQHFGRESNTPGWKTDMGRTYILLGPPVSRAPFRGYSQICPAELWLYRNPTGNPSLPPFFYILFYMPEDAAEFRYYRPFLDGPMKLVRGAQLQTNREAYELLKPLGGDLARAAFSLIPGDPLDTQEFQPSITSDVLVAKIENYANDAWERRRVREARRLRAQVQSWFLVPEERPLEAAVSVLADPQGEHWVDLAILIDDERLGRPDGRGNLVVSSGYRLFTREGELVFEDSAEASYPAYEQGRFRPFLLASRIPVAPGAYRLELEVVNREASRYRTAERIFDAGESVLGEPVLVQAVRTAGPETPGTPFRYFGVQFVPAANRVFTQRDSLRVLFPIQAEGSPERVYQLEYILAHRVDRDLRRTFTETVPGAEFRNGRLLKAKTLPLGDLAPGDYRMVIHLREQGSPRVMASANIGFHIQESSPLVELYVAGNRQGLSAPASAYLRGLAAVAQRRSAQAESYLRSAVESRPANPDALRLLASLYHRSGKHNLAGALYHNFGGAFLSSHPESLAQVALSLAHTGDLAAADNLLADGQRRFPNDRILRTAFLQIERFRVGRKGNFSSADGPVSRMQPLH